MYIYNTYIYIYTCIYAYIYMDICNAIVTSLLKNAQYHKQ